MNNMAGTLPTMELKQVPKMSHDLRYAGQFKVTVSYLSHVWSLLSGDSSV